MKTVFGIVLCLGVSLCLGCADSPQEDSMKVIPAELFSGECRAIAAHIADAYGGIRAVYDGPRRRMQLRAERWANGEIVDLTESIQDVTHVDGLIGVTIREMCPSQKSLQKVVISTPDGVQKVLFESYDLDEAKAPAFHTLQLSKETLIPLEEDTAIWGYGLFTETRKFSRQASIGENARTAQWAIVISIRLSDKLLQESPIQLTPTVGD